MAHARENNVSKYCAKILGILGVLFCSRQRVKFQILVENVMFLDFLANRCKYKVFLWLVLKCKILVSRIRCENFTVVV